jgi:hypothetical protein
MARAVVGAMSAPCPALFLRPTAQQVRTRRWAREVARGLVALANVVAWAAAVYLWS